MSLALAGLALLALALLAAAGFDLWRFEIPDTVTIVIIIAAVLFGLGTPGFAWASHAAAGGAFFAFGLLAFARGWLGGGDVKVMTGCACWASLATLAEQVVLIALAGGVLALVKALFFLPARQSFPRGVTAWLWRPAGAVRRAVLPRPLAGAACGPLVRAG